MYTCMYYTTANRATPLNQTGTLKKKTHQRVVPQTGTLRTTSQIGTSLKRGTPFKRGHHSNRGQRDHTTHSNKPVKQGKKPAAVRYGPCTCTSTCYVPARPQSTQVIARGDTCGRFEQVRSSRSRLPSPESETRDTREGTRGCPRAARVFFGRATCARL